MGYKEALIYSSGRAKIAEDQTQDLAFQKADMQSRPRPQFGGTQKSNTWNGNLGGAPKILALYTPLDPQNLKGGPPLPTES